MRAAWIWLVLTAPLDAEGLWTQIQEAVAHDPAAGQADLVDAEATLDLELVVRGQLPRVELTAPSLATASVQDANRSVSTALSGSVVQPLPGGGTLTGTWTPQLNRTLAPMFLDPQWSSTVSVTLDQPLSAGAGLEGRQAELDRAKARILRLIAYEGLFKAWLSRASDLDRSRQALRVAQANRVWAQARVDQLTSLAAQGRASESDVWKATRAIAEAQAVEARTAAQKDAREAAWTALAGSSAAMWTEEEVRALDVDLAADTPVSLEERLDAVERDRADVALAGAAASDAPVLRLGASAGAQSSSPGTWSATVGISLSTALWTMTPVREERARRERDLKTSVAQAHAIQRTLDRTQREAQHALNRELLVVQERVVARTAADAREARDLVTRGVLTEADALEVETGRVAAEADLRGLLWDLVLSRPVPTPTPP